MLKNTLLILVVCLYSIGAFAQKPKNGTYHFSIAYHNGESKPKNFKCDVIIRGDSILVLNDGSIPEVEKGAPIDGGRLMIHRKTGKWIIGRRPADRNAPEAGGCDGGPTIVDFKRKLVWLC